MLVATPSLEIVSIVEKLIIDGVVMEVKIIEEWGFNLGDDACLFEDGDSKSVSSDNEEDFVDPEVQADVDTLVKKLVDDLEEFEVKGAKDHEGSESRKQNVESADIPIGSLNKNSHVLVAASTSVELTNHIDLEVDIPELGTHKENSWERLLNQVVGKKEIVKRRMRAGSCPPGAGRSSVSGPWSMEWLSDQVLGDVGIVSSSRRKGKQVAASTETKHSEGASKSKRKKVGGVLRYNVHSLKKVARLPYNDRRAVLHELKRRIRKRHDKARVSRSVELVTKGISERASSSSSVNNDWKNWVVLKGNEEVEVEDVRGLGKAIGVNFKGESHNMFSVLSRVKKDKVKKLKSRGVGEGRRRQGEVE